MLSSSSSKVSQYLFVQKSAPEYANEPLANIQLANEMEFDVWYSNTAIYHTNWIKR
jgi:hypothetical protein